MLRRNLGDRLRLDRLPPGPPVRPACKQKTIIIIKNNKNKNIMFIILPSLGFYTSTTFINPRSNLCFVSLKYKTFSILYDYYFFMFALSPTTQPIVSNNHEILVVFKCYIIWKKND